MCAFVVEPKQTAETGHRSAPALRRAATGPAIAEAEKRKPATTVRHIVSFREIRPPAQTLGGSAVAYWMGHLREAGGIDIADEMIADFTSGAYGMVTNHSNVAMISRVKCLDRIDGHLWFTRLHGPSDSSIDIEYEWHNVLADGRTVPVARASMTMSWVKKLTHGRIEPAPLPAYWRAFLATRIDDRRSAPLDAAEPAAAQTATFSIESPPIYVARPGRGPRPVLHRQTFETSNCASNLVGNVYFAEYYGWQDAVLDAYMHRLRKLTSGRSADGEGLHCLHEDVRHLREAMPFDTVETVMTLNALHRDGLQLGFEHYRLEPDRTRVKLAVGSASYGWVSRAGRAERIETRPLPAELLCALEELCDAAEVTAHR
jgi:acyl-CoA thioesterase FadM